MRFVFDVNPLDFQGLQVKLSVRVQLFNDQMNNLMSQVDEQSFTEPHPRRSKSRRHPEDMVPKSWPSHGQVTPKSWPSHSKIPKSQPNQSRQDPQVAAKSRPSQTSRQNLQLTAKSLQNQIPKTQESKSQPSHAQVTPKSRRNPEVTVPKLLSGKSCPCHIMSCLLSYTQVRPGRGKDPNEPRPSRSNDSIPESQVTPKSRPSHGKVHNSRCPIKSSPGQVMTISPSHGVQVRSQSCLSHDHGTPKSRQNAEVAGGAQVTAKSQQNPQVTAPNSQATAKSQQSPKLRRPSQVAATSPSHGAQVAAPKSQPGRGKILKSKFSAQVIAPMLCPSHSKIPKGPSHSKIPRFSRGTDSHMVMVPSRR